MSFETIDKIRNRGIKYIVKTTFIWGIVLALISSPIFVYLV